MPTLTAATTGRGKRKSIDTDEILVKQAKHGEYDTPEPTYATALTPPLIEPSDSSQPTPPSTKPKPSIIAPSVLAVALSPALTQRSRATLLSRLPTTMEPLLLRARQTTPIPLAVYSYRRRNGLKNSVMSFANHQPESKPTTTTQSTQSSQPTQSLANKFSSTTIGTANSIRLVTERALKIGRASCRERV